MNTTQNQQPGFNKKGKILVVYYHNFGYPFRKSQENNLYCFERYSDCLVYYLNAAYGVPEYLKQVNFDLIVYHMLLLAKKSFARRFNYFLKHGSILKEFKGYKIALPQDEYYYTDVINKFLDEFHIDHVFTLTTSSELKKIYHDRINGKMKFNQILTGYLDDKFVEKIKEIAAEVNPQRDIDIGYRTDRLPYSLGSHAYLKTRLAEEFSKNSPKFGLNVDISMRHQDIFTGLDWYKFLLRCKYTIGVEGGASILDPDGKINDRTEDYVAKNPSASFDEVSNVCFREHDGNIDASAISPRMLETCATRTCQILIEGEYAGILKPDLHYIELKKDFSNLDKVLEIVKTDKLRETIIEQAYKDIVESKKYTYEVYIKELLEKSLGVNYQWSPVTDIELKIYHKNRSREKLIWKYIPLRTNAINLVLNRLPLRYYDMVVKYMKNVKS